MASKIEAVDDAGTAELRALLATLPSMPSTGSRPVSQWMHKSGAFTARTGPSLASRTGGAVIKFQPVLNQWMARPVDDARLRALSRPRRELKEDQPEEPVIGRGRTSLDPGRLESLARPKEDSRSKAYREAAAAKESEPRRKLDHARLSSLAEPNLRKLRNFSRGPLLSTKLLAFSQLQ
mmetsp:Transcript_76811/g.197816  ORF Transcript_76811/g.197816 Transcript_76811/m.197816 type:complete len:179 (+) Transcript_76811:59-595(+)